MRKDLVFANELIFHAQFHKNAVVSKDKTSNFWKEFSEFKNLREKKIVRVFIQNFENPKSSVFLKNKDGSIDIEMLKRMRDFVLIRGRKVYGFFESLTWKGHSKEAQFIFSDLKNAKSFKNLIGTRRALVQVAKVNQFFDEDSIEFIKTEFFSSSSGIYRLTIVEKLMECGMRAEAISFFGLNSTLDRYLVRNVLTAKELPFYIGRGSSATQNEVRIKLKWLSEHKKTSYT